jgi:hypothetical protein
MIASDDEFEGKRTKLECTVFEKKKIRKIRNVGNNVPTMVIVPARGTRTLPTLQSYNSTAIGRKVVQRIPGTRTLQ